MHAPASDRPAAAAGGPGAPSTSNPHASSSSTYPYRPQQLASAADDLAALLARGQATLDALSARLEAEFATRFDSSSSSSTSSIDPCALAQRARRLERELPSLRAEAEAAAAARRALAERAALLLGGTRARLHELSVRAGLAPPRDQREGATFDAAVWAAGEAAAAMAAVEQE
jgi:hypothetical protein